VPPAPRAWLQVAYDYDFTIAHYNVSLGHTIYELAKQHLVRRPPPARVTCSAH
jgi:hypothetical protein